MIRLNTGSGVKFTDKSGKPAQLNISRGKVCVLKNVYYKGRIPVHLAGVWEAGCSQPLWVMTSLEDPRKGLEIYRRLMTIEESFKDLKSLLHLSKLMNRSRDRAETMIALTLIAYSLAYTIGETAREEVCTKKRLSYSPLFVLLKHNLRLRRTPRRRIKNRALARWKFLICRDVPT